MEMIWYSNNLETKSLFTGVLYNRYNPPPPDFCWDILCKDAPITSGNVHKRIQSFVSYVKGQHKSFKSNSIAITMGGDFYYSVSFDLKASFKPYFDFCRDKGRRQISREMETIWYTNKNNTQHLFTGVLYNHYSPPPGFCWDLFCDDDPIVDDKESKSYNIDERILSFINYVKTQTNRNSNIP